MVDLGITRHCLDRYCERIRPSLNPRYKGDRTRANAEIERLVRENGLIVPQRPDWIGPVIEETADFWVVVDCIAFPVRGNELLTVYAKGHISSRLREDRNAHKQRARAKRRQERHRERMKRERDWQ